MSLKRTEVLSIPPLYSLTSFILNPEVGSTAAPGIASSLHVHIQGITLSLSIRSLGICQGNFSLQSHWPGFGHMPIVGSVQSKGNPSVPALGVASTAREE